MALLSAPALLSAADEIKVRHILVRKKAEAEAALADLVNLGITRDNFIQVARKHSLDAVTKGAGGDLGWNTRSKFVPEFSDIAFGLEPGGVSEPVRSRYGWHVIFVEQKREVTPNKEPNKPAAPGASAAPPIPGSAESAAAPGVPPAPKPAADPKALVPNPPAETVKPATPPSTPATPAPTTPGAATTPVAPQTPAPAVAEAPKYQPKGIQPAKLILVSLEAQNRRLRALPTQTLDLLITLDNQGKEEAKILHPDLLALGLTVKTDLGVKEPPIDLAAVATPAAFVVDLPSRSLVGRSIALSDYFKDLPLNSRLSASWSGRKLLENFEKKFPGESAKIADFEKAKATLSAGLSELRVAIDGLQQVHQRPGPRQPRELPLAIFDALDLKGRYFARLEVVGESSPLWFELFTEKQFQAVNHFANLALQGFYDTLPFFDIDKASHLRGGCPRGDGTGGPETYIAVTNAAGIQHQKGTLSLVTRTAAGGVRQAGSIFFIGLKDHPEWDALHVPIGKLAGSEEVLTRIADRALRSIGSITIVPADKAPAEITGVAPAVAAPGQPARAEGAKSEAQIVEGAAPPKVLIETSKGNLTVELFQDDAVNTVNNFISLAEKGFFNPDAAANKAALQVLEKQDKYYVRTGSPDNSDTGGPGYRISSEVLNNTRLHETGTLSMCLEVDPSTGKPVPNTAGSQFMICLNDMPFWNGLYTPFGKVTEGFEVLRTLSKGDSIQSVRVLAKRRNAAQPQTLPLLGGK